MITTHAFWDRGELSIWAEDAENGVTSPSQALRSARPHPFAASTESLREFVAGDPGDAALQLPSLRRSPLDSPELVRVTPRQPARSAPQLLTWTVPVVRLRPADALAWLTDPGEIHSRIGASVTYLRELARFGRELTDRGRLLPTVEYDDSGTFAIWRPVLQGPDVPAFQQVVGAMPPVCRAVPGMPHSRAVVEDALTALVDASVRERLSEPGLLLPPRRGRKPRVQPVAESWLAALTGPEGHFDDGDDDTLARSLRPWAEFGVGRVGPAKATFRLVELDYAGATDVAVDEAGEEEAGDEEAKTTPGDASQEPSSRWRVEFLLQSTEDPSLLIPAGQAWGDTGALSRWVERPIELLLAELGRASRIYPALEAGLRQSRPEHLDLDTTGAFEFLSVAAPALDEAGFGVLVPNWWWKRRTLGLTMRVSTPSESDTGESPRFGRDQLCEFEWRLAVGDESLSDEEIAALAAAKAPLVRLRGQWVAVDPEQLRQGLDFLTRESTGRTTAARVLQLAAADPTENELPFEVTDVEADGWLGALLEGTSAQQIEPVEPPPTLQAELRPYQQRGLSWLAFLSRVGVGACLADDMGLGKTLQVLALETTERFESAGLGPTLLLCPMSLVSNWQAEARKFAPGLRLYAHHGPQRLRGEELSGQLADVDMVITTYATATRDISELGQTAWNRIVLDEAQAIKNRLARTTKAVNRLEGRHRIALTGTPVENRLGELWSIMNFLNPGLLGSAETFRTRFAIPIERDADADVAQHLRKITRPYVLRRVKTDPTVIDDLPEKMEIKQYYRLTTEQASLYQSVVADMMAKIEDSDGIERRGNVLAAMTKLKQVCNHPAQLLHDRSALEQRSGKVNRLEEIMEEILSEGDRVLCFTQYSAFAELIVPHLAARFGTDVLYLHGGTSRAAREQMVARFQSGEGPPIFVLSLKAGGTGLNLTAANHVIHLDRWWNPAVENQATDRAFRIGQKRNVQVRKFIGTGTLEEKIDTMLEEKAALADLVVGDGEGWLTELSTGDLRDLFTLSEGATGE